jgi:hypothetical protein
MTSVEANVGIALIKKVMRDLSSFGPSDNRPELRLCCHRVRSPIE